MKVWIHPRQPDRVASWLPDAGFAVDAELTLLPYSDRPQALLFATGPQRDCFRSPVN
jgi:hypothetical protein